MKVSHQIITTSTFHQNTSEILESEMFPMHYMNRAR